MDPVAKTLFHPFRPVPELPSVFLNARACTGLPLDMACQQNFKPFAQEIIEQGLGLHPEIPAGIFMRAYVLLPQNAIEAKYLVACGLQILDDQGVIAIAGANDAGGKRVRKILEDFGVIDIQDYAANKARVAWGIKKDMNAAALEAIEAGQPCSLKNGFISQPGVFAWDRIDEGSALLTRYLPGDLKGVGADFGCGTGFISRYVLENNPDVRKFFAIDADARAVRLCEDNIKGRAKIPMHFLWEDLTQPVPDLKDLDFIVMNPPFHEGKKTDADIGKDFIRMALATLRHGGTLWMVANAGLPYEDVLKKEFSTCSKIVQEKGFKIYCAIR